MRLSQIALTACLFACALHACGPSPRWQHVGNRYFEYCHQADVTRSASDAELAQCWRAWLDHYTGGQSTERVQHAKERHMLLRGGEALRISLPASDEAHLPPVQHDDPGPPLDCTGLCETQFEQCALACQAEVEATEDEEKKVKASNCSPACEQERRVCKQGCL